MRRKLVFYSLAAVFVLVCFGVGLAADYDAMVKEGDSWWAQRADMTKTLMAVETYREAIKADPAKLDAYWRLSRALYRVGQHAKTNEDKIAAHEEAIAAAEKAIAIAPDDVVGHYWLGVNYGLYGQAKGVMKSLSLVDPIKKEMGFVIAKDPGYLYGGAYRVLGRLLFKVPGMFGGDKAKAVENLQTAIKYGPQSWLSHVYLAEIFIDQEKYPEAKALLDQVAAGACDQGQEAECNDWKQEAKALEAELAKKMK